MRVVGLPLGGGAALTAPAAPVTTKVPDAAPAGQAPAAAPTEKPIDKMTVTELRSYAAAKGIDVTGAAKKEDLLLAVQTALEDAAPEPAEEGTATE